MGICEGNCVNTSIGVGVETYREPEFIRMEPYIEGKVSVSVKCPKSKGPYCTAGKTEHVCMNRHQHVTDITSEIETFELDSPEEPLMMNCERRGEQFKIGQDNIGAYIIYFPKTSGCRCRGN